MFKLLQCHKGLLKTYPKGLPQGIYRQFRPVVQIKPLLHKRFTHSNNKPKHHNIVTITTVNGICRMKREKTMLSPEKDNTVINKEEKIYLGDACPRTYKFVDGVYHDTIYHDRKQNTYEQYDTIRMNFEKIYTGVRDLKAIRQTRDNNTFKTVTRDDLVHMIKRLYGTDGKPVYLWKACKSPDYAKDLYVKLEIPNTSNRVLTASTRLIRVEEAKVVDIVDIKGNQFLEAKSFLYQKSVFNYKVGETIKEPNFNPNSEEETGEGISCHFDQMECDKYFQDLTFVDFVRYVNNLF